jgi:hypothetical protein
VRRPAAFVGPAEFDIARAPRRLDDTVLSCDRAKTRITRR